MAAGSSYSDMIKQAKEVAAQEKAKSAQRSAKRKKTSPKEDPMAAQLLADLEDNPYQKFTHDISEDATDATPTPAAEAAPTTPDTHPDTIPDSPDSTPDTNRTGDRTVSGEKTGQYPVCPQDSPVSHTDSNPDTTPDTPKETYRAHTPDTIKDTQQDTNPDATPDTYPEQDSSSLLAMFEPHQRLRISGKRAEILRLLIAISKEKGDSIITVTLSAIAKHFATNYDYIRHSITALEKKGVLTKLQSTKRSGIQIRLDKPLCAEFMKTMSADPVPGTLSGNIPDTPKHDDTGYQTGHITGQGVRSSNSPLLVSKKETYLQRKKPEESLEEKESATTWGMSSDTIAAAWPHLAKAGWTRNQMRQLRQVFEGRGIDFAPLRQALNHAEWELSTKGQLSDKSGTTVANPVAWLFGALKKTGYYARPEGYESPQEQYAREQAEEAQRIAKYRKAAEQVEKQDAMATAMEWYRQLPEEDQKNILKRQPGGGSIPQEPWILREYKRIMKD
ncbi:hypothetical protein ACI3L3_16650 [Desulfobaculum sp. SPO524]|uniref:hypothetical protein n=1 Tax=Desulfobaculum sp. SPO524 TaxID=3378071 RepID=UPI003854B370